jgi:hypothetical protein
VLIPQITLSTDAIATSQSFDLDSTDRKAITFKYTQHPAPNATTPQHMVLSPRRVATFTPAQLAGFFFQPCRDEFDYIISESHRCRCGTVRKQANWNGISNLVSHVRSEHPNHVSLMLAATSAETGSIIDYVRRSSLNLFSWLEWVLKNNLPLSFSENEAARR